MECPACKSDNADGANFCSNCGTILGIKKKPPPSDASAVYHRLGPREYVDRLKESSGRMTSERRVVTTLFVDVVNSTGMGERLDPELITEVMNGAFVILAEPVHTFGGTVARLMGDGMLCLFGAPVAHGDDAVRACRAGLAMKDKATEYADALKRRLGLQEFGIRIGISTGLAVVGEVGSQARAEYTAMGDAVNLAARLQGAAEPNSILICDETARMVSSMLAVEAAGKLQLKGKGQPVAAFRLLRGGPLDESTLDVTGDVQLTRQAIMDQLRAAVDHVLHGEGGCITISADAGMGKSYLLERLLRTLPNSVESCSGSCAVIGQMEPYAGAREAFLSLLGIDSFATPKAIDEALRSSLHEVLFTGEMDEGDFEEIAALLKHLLQAPLKESEEARLRRFDAEEIARRVGSTFCMLIRLIASRKPLVMVWDDAHEIDPQSLSLLQCLAETTRMKPLLLLIAHRGGGSRLEESLADRKTALGRYHRALLLEPLTPEESMELLKKLSRLDQVSQEILNPIVRAGKGNPLHLREILRAVLERGQDSSTNSAEWRFSLRDVDLPQTIQAAILARVDRLPYRSKRLLQLASVFGRYFHQEAMVRAIIMESSDTSIENSLEVLQEAGFIEPAPVAAGGMTTDSTNASIAFSASYVVGHLSGSRYRFTDSLTAEVVYNSLLKAEKVKLHKQAGELLEETFQARCDDLAPTLAYHFERGRVPEKTLPYLLMSADKSIEIKSFERAGLYLRRAARLLEKYPDAFDSTATEEIACREKKLKTASGGIEEKGQHDDI